MMTNNPQQPDRSIPPFNETNAETPAIGGGLPVIQYWAEHTLSPDGVALWKTLLHKSACLSCSWGTGGQKGGFTNEEGEKVQRCMKSVEAITSELQPPISHSFFDRFSIHELQQLTSMSADKLGRLSYPVILRDRKSTRLNSSHVSQSRMPSSA